MASLLLSWLLGLSGFVFLLTAGNRDGAQDPTRKKRWILVRHGESVNNLLSQDKAVLQWLREGGLRNKQDPVLSLKGQEQCINASQILFGGCHDKYKIFEAGFGAVYVSPLQRALQTALLTFGCVAKNAHIPFKALPWAHEARKSQSDVGLPSSKLVGFVKDQVTFSATVEPLRSLTATLSQLPEDWSTNPKVPSEILPYYPKGRKKESGDALERRMLKLQEEMLAIPEEAAILVAHSGVIRWLLKAHVRNAKPDNVAMFYGELTDGSWNNVILLGDVLGLQGLLPGFMPSKKAVDCRQGNCDDFDEQFVVLGTASKAIKGECCKYPIGKRHRLFVYDAVFDALTYYKPGKDPQSENARASIKLQDDTTVWYTKETIQEGNAMPIMDLLTCDDACPPRDDILKSAKKVVIFTPAPKGKKDFTCQPNGGCLLGLDVDEPEEGEQLPAALKIAIAVACSRNGEKDVVTLLRTYECEKDDFEMVFRKSLQRSRTNAILSPRKGGSPRKSGSLGKSGVLHHSQSSGGS